ncbi:putative MFS family arabinose efflux permease [Nocardioides sp. BE266]|uniref:MFS transporter n=1 Tax=Nocardioides sp. BE266 TaxID=2817725 RepID=UPI00285659DB|nr:MFS transporter [Nocardioides sp. BE266]MDR7255633.1 putative MFS family arabinose efflux permease [Nocardioides sp. BE266]
MTAEQIHDIGRRRAWVIWFVALAVYILAVFHRSSLGVAGIIAADRFHISATSLATFTVLQLVVYAGMQVPVGVLLDRYGSRTMLLGGLVLMTAGQLGFAFSGSFVGAVLARAVVGAGDAMIFVSVIRLVTVWFLVRQAPMVTQVTGLSGQLGAIAAAAPLSYLLHELGWTRTFAITSSVGVVLLVAVAALVKDSPYRRDDVVAIKLSALAQSVRTVWGNPGTRLGMWSHFTSQFSATVFALLWGYPFLVQGLGWSSGAASSLLMAMTAWTVFSGLALARLVARLPYYRSFIVIGVVIAMVVPWTAVLLWPGSAPAWLVVVMAFATASGGPAAMVAFDLARSFTPPHAIGRANGLVNVGGFTASLLTMGLIGVVLDLSSPGGMDSYTLGDFKLALSVQYLFWTFGIVQILRYRRRGLAHLARVHPGSVDQMKAGRPFVHPGIGTEGV